MQDQMKSCAVNHGLACLNPNCRSKGKPHYGCLCYGGGGEGDHLAQGGMICAGPHQPHCEYYLDGGMVNTNSVSPDHAIGHAAVSHGFMGLMKNVGKDKMADPEKHHKVLDKVKSHISNNDHDSAVDELHGHPMSGSVGKNHLKEIVGHLGPSVMGQESNPDGLRSSVDYLHSSIKGHDHLKSHVNSFLDSKKNDMEPDEGHRKSLKEFLSEAQQNPEKLLEVGGSLGHYMPDHAAGLGAMTATAVEYLNSIKPMNSQTGMLDEVIKPDKTAMYQWDRQLDIAQKPMLVLQHVKDGTLLPADLTTLSTIYPKLRQSMVEKTTEMLVDFKSKDKEIPYKQKQMLSMLLGQPIDSTQTPQAMQAIMAVNGPVQQQNKNSGPPKKATAAELKQINKTDEMGETTLEARQINRNKH